MAPLPILPLLRCTGCRSAGLREGPGTLTCAACGRRFPVQADVPVLLDDAVADRGPLLEPEVAEAVMRRLGMPANAIDLLRVRRASGARVQLAAGAVALAADGHAFPGLVPSFERPGSAGLRPEWLREYIPRAMPPAEELLANVQFRNAGGTVMRAAGTDRVSVVPVWQEAGGPEREDLRTPLPCDLAPGAVLTVPVRLRPPAAAGRATLALRLVQEGVEWLEPRFGPWSVTIEPGVAFRPPPEWLVRPPEGADDRAGAVALLRRWLAEHAPANPRVLELGSGAGPAASDARHDPVVADPDLLALQLGRLRGGAPLRTVCADLADLPLPEGAFDAVVSLGALHYQRDPVAVLRNVRAHLRPGGFIALLCLPVGQMWPGAPAPSVLAELRRGLNPQGFSAAEYHAIFAAARLRVGGLVIDGASMKVRLLPEAAHA